MVYRGTDPEFWGVCAKTDRQLNQFCSGSGRPSAAGDARGCFEGI
jgi:hypothetical protein